MQKCNKCHQFLTNLQNMKFILIFMLLSISIICAVEALSMTPVFASSSHNSSIWSEGAKIPTPRTELMAEVVNDKIYVTSTTQIIETLRSIKTKINFIFCKLVKNPSTLLHLCIRFRRTLYHNIYRYRLINPQLIPRSAFGSRLNYF